MTYRAVRDTLPPGHLFVDVGESSSASAMLSHSYLHSGWPQRGHRHRRDQTPGSSRCRLCGDRNLGWDSQWLRLICIIQDCEQSSGVFISPIMRATFIIIYIIYILFYANYGRFGLFTYLTSLFAPCARCSPNLYPGMNTLSRPADSASLIIRAMSEVRFFLISRAYFI